MPFSQLPALLSAWLATIAAALWFRAAGITTDFRRASSALWAAGRRAENLAFRLLRGPLAPLLALAPGGHLLFALDDTPTARYGPRVQGAGTHHNPRPGPAGERFVYGHVWVTLAWLARHPLWDTLSLPLRALLYVRKKGVPRLAKAYPWEFRTKLELAAELAGWLAGWLRHAGKALWLVADGAYAKRPFLKPALALGLVVFSRLRKGARLWGLPSARRRPGQRGPLPTYGKGRIDLAKRAGQRRGWQELEWCSMASGCARRSRRSRRRGGRSGAASGWSSCASRAAGWRTSGATRPSARWWSWK